MKQNLFKRIGFVLTLVLTLGLYANAQDAVWYYDGSLHSTPSDFWSSNYANIYSPNPSAEIWSYAGKSGKKAVKFGNGINISFTALAKFDLVIVAAYRSGYMSANNRSFKITYPDGTSKNANTLCTVETDETTSAKFIKYQVLYQELIN